MAIGSPDLSAMEAEVMKNIEPLVEMPMTPPLADETPPDEMTADVIEAEEEKVEEDETPPDEAPSDEIPAGEDEVDEPEQTSEAVTEIAADTTPMEMKKEESGTMGAVEAAVEESMVQAADSTSGGCKMAQQAFSNVKESAHQAVEAIGNKVAKFFGNMRKVKSLLHINEAAESGKEEEAKTLSNSTGNLHKLTDSIKSRACVIL
ncbi:hypothetical protein B566_EDAN009434 [Ephemera danica]|nr:hypothetical protein B566_EDAN009434 [Ephemera danica]